MLQSLTVILPAYNEEEGIELCVLECLKLKSLDIASLEILVCENGSTDNTLIKALNLSERYSEVKVYHSKVASYGEALRLGLRKACHEISVIFNVDFYDTAFVERALIEIREGADIVVGSKLKVAGMDQRPLLRRLISRLFNWLLRRMFGFKGTDTHGLKTFRTPVLRSILEECQTHGEIFDTELILRAETMNATISEIPIQIVETRASRYSLIKRVPTTLRDLLQLWASLRISGKNVRILNRNFVSKKKINQ